MVMPDGTFSIELDGGKALIQTDPFQIAPCESPLTLQLYGQIDCKDPDRPQIEVFSEWHLKRYAEPSPLPSTWVNASPSPIPTSSPAVTPQPAPSPSNSPVVTPSASPRPQGSPAPRLSLSSVRLDTPIARAPIERLIRARSPERGDVNSESPRGRPLCRLPETCHFYSAFTFQQCQ
jgi:hypothetical protein